MHYFFPHDSEMPLNLFFFTIFLNNVSEYISYYKKNLRTNEHFASPSFNFKVNPWITIQINHGRGIAKK